jgi:four helix bundle protein
MRNFRQYDIWKNAIEIASNIAEGAARKSEKEFSYYLQVALGSAFEVETQLIISKELLYIKETDLDELFEKLHILQRQIKYLTNKLKN